MADEFGKFKGDVTALSSDVLTTLKEANTELTGLEKITLNLDNEVMALLGKDNEILVIYQNMMNGMKLIHQKAVNVNHKLHALANHYKAVGLHISKLRSGTVTDARTAHMVLQGLMSTVLTDLNAVEAEITAIATEAQKYRNTAKNADLKAGDKKRILSMAMQTTEAAIKRSRSTHIAIKKVHNQANTLMTQIVAARSF